MNLEVNVKMVKREHCCMIQETIERNVILTDLYRDLPVQQLARCLSTEKRIVPCLSTTDRTDLI